ncbi:hypothetical protein FM038_012205 [Shewanella eurypsychrophilus]|uniref:ABC transporter substrate-binding protein n=2 Tax=Shewanellaceae TaxID=267890 RepID=A0ABX6VGE1_9GAMM|nr:hypothetical protein FS418_13785 [Shewanella sp. YLB-09]QPG60457.1 hypothetical protein FM038_012205 [Shewanella eurypsychrophilus]
MDTKRQPIKKHVEIANEAWRVIEQESPKLILLADDNALRLLGPRIEQQQIPLVFLGINANPRHYIKLNKNISGTLERPLLKRSVMMLKSIMPGISRIKVLMDANPTSFAILETSFDDKFNQQIAATAVDTKLKRTFAEWKTSIKKSKQQGYDAIIVANYAALTDEQGNNVSLDEVSEWTSEHSPVPMFAFWGYSIGKGKAIGGLTISGTQQGIEAAKKVNHFFKTGKLPAISTPARGTFVFSEHELKRWAIELPKQIENKSTLLL